MAVETLLTRALGEVAGMLHTARSRNDQVALDLRLHVREQSALALEELSELLRALRIGRTASAPRCFPDTTHRQRAQAVSAAYYLCAWAQCFARDVALVRATASLEMPLGVGALAGTSWPIDREIVRRLLRFDRLTATGWTRWATGTSCWTSRTPRPARFCMPAGSPPTSSTSARRSSPTRSSTTGWRWALR